MLLSEVADVVEQGAASLVLEPFLGPRLAERLAGEACADYVHLRDIVDYITDITENVEAPRLAPIGLVDLSGMLVYVCGEDAFVTKLVQGGVETSDATEEIGESHQHPKEASG